MRFALTTAVQNTALLGGILTLAVAGVNLYIDSKMESYYIEVAPEYDRDALVAISRLAGDLGYEVMPEWECPPEHRPDGAIRHWMAEKEDVYDRTLKAV